MWLLLTTNPYVYQHLLTTYYVHSTTDKMFDIVNIKEYLKVT